MTPGVGLILLGRQGAGKGTQCVRLSRHYVVPHISTGDMLRAAVTAGSPLGIQARRYMDAGELLPDDIMIAIVGNRLHEADAKIRGYILDGFPRTVNQAEALIRITSTARPVDVVIDLEVPRELVLARLAARRVCVDCQTNYSTLIRPRRDWTCDVCGGDVVQRTDDTEDAITRRLDLYDQQTAPLIDFYRDRDELAVVDGVGHPDEVLHRLNTTIESRRK